MSKLSTIKELCQFMWLRKKWWLFPVVVLLILLMALIILSQSSSLAPFIYPLF